jgi:hypothetical protein
MAQPASPPGGTAILRVTVTLNGQPVANAQVVANFYYPSRVVTCQATSDATGVATCTEIVPQLANGTVILVQVYVAAPDGESAQTSTTFTVQRGSL